MSEMLNMNEAVLNPAPVLVRERVAACAELTKPKIAAMVLVATTLGFYLAVPGALTLSLFPLFLHTLLGTAMVAGGANALNQFVEARHDARMIRTRNRPLPSGRLSAGEVLAFSLGSGIGGVLYLALLVNPLAALIAAVAYVSYAFICTPLKRVTPLCVFVGAVPGALPPVIGWAAAAGALPLAAWLPFSVLFFWQLPHFAAISWLYREDYARAGYPLLSVIDADGTRINLHMISHTLALMAASVLPALYGLAGPLYAVAAMVLGVAFLICGVLFVRYRSDATARFHLFASVVYLPALFGLMMIDKTPVV